MSTLKDILQRPPVGADHTAQSRFVPEGIVLGLMGLALIVVGFIGNLAAIGEGGTSLREILAWTFGVTTLGLVVLKTGIAVLLMGINKRLWIRVESVKTALASLRKDVEPQVKTGDYKSAYGPAVASESVPGLLPIHKMARALWLPMLVMGVMVGFVLSLV